VDIEGARGERSPVNITPARGSSSVLINGVPAKLPVSFTPEGEIIRVNGRPYRGRIELLAGSGGLRVVDELDIETYLAGLINYEISARWPADAVKTQAVIARTYALYQKRKSKGGQYHIEGSTLGQVYKGINAEDRAALKAVNDTRGQVLTYRGKLALTVYHSNAGGRTDASADVWSGDYSYLRSVRSPYDVVSPDYSWNFTMPAEVLGGLLVRGGYDIGSPVSVKIKARTPGGRARQVRIRSKDGRVILLEAEKFRKIIGYSALRSTKFKVGRRGDLFVFKGKGSGHGVGLSQWGAKGMAENGYSYRQILKHYYPGTKLKKVY
jgi:stage II sporulation protein D